MADATNDRTVSDVMLRNPKTLPSEVTAAEARAALEREGTYVVLLVDGSRFCGAVTEVPADADPGDRAIRFVDASAPVAREDTPVPDALALLDERPLRACRPHLLTATLGAAKNGINPYPNKFRV